MNISKETVKMLDKQHRKVTVRKCRMQINLDLGWTLGWPEDEKQISKDKKAIVDSKESDIEVVQETAEQLDAEKVDAEKEAPETIGTEAEEISAEDIQL